MAAGEDAGGLCDVVAPADDLEVGVAATGLAEVREAVAVTGEVQAGGLSARLFRSFSAPA